MNKSALTVDPDGAPVCVEIMAPMQATSKIVVFGPAVSPTICPPRRASEKERRRRAKLHRFIWREAIAGFFLIFFLSGAHNRSVVELGLSSAFVTGVVIACLAVVGIPVIFYGLPAEKYRYRERRYRRP